MINIDDFLSKEPKQSDKEKETDDRAEHKVKKEKKHFHKKRRMLNEELSRVHKRVSGFNARESVAWKGLTEKFGDKLTHEELISIAELIANAANIKLDRDAKRRKVVLIKWFEEHWQSVQPYLPIITLD